MPRYAAYSDSETDFSETDESIIDAPRGQRTAFRRRSMSRHHLSPDYLGPDYRNPYLGPPAATGMRRSLSTGRGRRGAREGPAAVVVDIQNDSRNKSTDRSRRLSRNYNAVDLSDDDDVSIEEIIRSHRRRPRASTSHSRDRDYELLMDQRILEKNDTRQDMELMRQQQEIERLERELARRREGNRLHRDEEEWYEYEIHDRLRKLDRLERKQRLEEERRSAELRYKMKQYEDEEEKERVRQEIRDEEARKKVEEEEKRKKMIKLKQEAVEEWKLREEAREAEEQKAKEEKDKEFRQRLKSEFGYSEEEIEKILARRKDAKDEKSVVRREVEKTTWIKVRFLCCCGPYHSDIAISGPSSTPPAGNADRVPLVLGLGRCKLRDLCSTEQQTDSSIA